MRLLKQFAFICVYLRPLVAADDPVAQIEQQLKKIAGVYAAVEREGADPVPADIAIYQGAIPGMLRTLDPHSVFFDPDQFEQLQQMQSSERKGFGSVVSLLPGRLIVLQTLEGSPSAKAGLSAGDARGAQEQGPHRQDRRGVDHQHAARGGGAAPARRTRVEGQRLGHP